MTAPEHNEAEHNDVVRNSFTQQVGLFTGENSPFARRFASPLAWIEPLDAEMIVLDVACGAGHAAEQAAPHVRQVVGIDLTPALLTAFKKLVDQGWCDAVRSLHPSKPMFTFWDYKRNRWPRDAGLRLDHLLVSPKLASRLVKAGVDRKLRGEDGASDHAPAWIVLE